MLHFYSGIRAIFISHAYLDGIVKMSWEAVLNEQRRKVQDTVDELSEMGVAGEVQGKVPGVIGRRLAALLQDRVKTIQDVHPVEQFTL